MSEPRVQELEPGLFLIDHHFEGLPGIIGSYLLAGDDDDLTLIETGPTSTLDTLLAGVRAAGFEPEQIRQFAVSHIHLDHAGSAGVLLRDLPEARLLVHRIGAPHMIDPTRLLASATRIFGDDMDRLWGEVVPVAEEQVVILDDGSTFQAGGRTLTALDTPGHAYHHMAYHDAASGSIFTGDVGAVRLDGAAYVRPPVVPPELDIVAWCQSVHRMRALRPRRLYLTHYGAFDDPDWHFDDLLFRLGNWAGWLEARLDEQPDQAALTEELRDRGNAEIVAITGSDALVLSYEVATSYSMFVTGAARYFRKQREREAS